MADLVAYLRARLDEEEALASGRADDWTNAWHTLACGEKVLYWAEECRCGVPARVLAEIAAKRAVLDLWERREGQWSGEFDQDDEIPRALVQSYADRPDFDPTWRV